MGFRLAPPRRSTSKHRLRLCSKAQQSQAATPSTRDVRSEKSRVGNRIRKETQQGSRVELRDLYSLCRLAEFGNVTRAARDIGVDPSTLSRRISALEEELGVLLFERGRGGVRITPAGRDVVRLARRAIADVDGIRHVAAQSSLALVGELRLATQTTSLGPRLRPAISVWRTAHPKVALKLFEVDDNEALAGMRERQLDAAVIFSQGTADMAYQDLWDERLILAVSDRHSLAGKEPVDWAQIRAETVLVCGPKGSEALRSLQVGLLGPGVDVRIQHAGSLNLLNLVAMGEGVLLLCENHRETAFPGVRLLDIAEANARVSVVLTWRPDLEDPLAGSFVAFMRDWVRSRPAIAEGAATS